MLFFKTRLYSPSEINGISILQVFSETFVFTVSSFKAIPGRLFAQYVGNAAPVGADYSLIPVYSSKLFRKSQPLITLFRFQSHIYSGKRRDISVECVYPYENIQRTMF